MACARPRRQRAASDVATECEQAAGEELQPLGTEAAARHEREPGPPQRRTIRSTASPSSGSPVSSRAAASASVAAEGTSPSSIPSGELDTASRAAPTARSRSPAASAVSDRLSSRPARLWLLPRSRDSSMAGSSMAAPSASSPRSIRTHARSMKANGMKAGCPVALATEHDAFGMGPALRRRDRGRARRPRGGWRRPAAPPAAGRRAGRPGPRRPRGTSGPPGRGR